jgi:hypothetical protein
MKQHIDAVAEQISLKYKLLNGMKLHSLEQIS